MYIKHFQHKILITGGHAGTTALATMQELKRRRNWEISWLGTRHAIEGKKQETLEFKVFSNFDVDYYELETGRLQRKFTKHTIPSLFRIPKGFFNSYKLISKIKPEIVLSFGGFVSVPVLLSAWIQSIPIVIHEQTIAIGLANKITSIFAEKIALARLESKKYFNIDKNKVVHVGNPINNNIIILKNERFQHNNLNKKNKTLFIMGGSRGAQVINKVIFKSLNALTKNYKIIHLTGETDFKLAKKYKSKFGNKYNPVSFINPQKIGEFYAEASLVISRAGANTVAELIYLKIPSILIPIPWVQHNEQYKNALLAQKQGIAKIINQDDLNSDNLIKNIENISNKKKLKFIKLKTTSKDEHAASNLVDLLENVLK